MPTSYELQLQALDLVAQLGNEELTDDEAEALVDNYMSAAEHKIDGYRAVLDNLAANEAYNKSIGRRHYEHASRIKAHRDRLAQRLIALLQTHGEATGQTVIQSATNRASLATSVRCEGPKDAGEWPAEYQKITVSPDRALAKKALKAGKEVPGCRLVETQHLRWGMVK